MIIKPSINVASCLSLWALMCITSSVNAQTTPNAGTFIREIESVPEAINLQENTTEFLEPQKEASATTQTSGTEILIKDFNVTGVTVFSDEAIKSLLLDGKNKKHNLAELQNIAARITHYYHNQGYFLARAYLPQQDIESGVVTIAVLEGILEELKINNTSHVRNFVIERPFKSVTTGSPLQAKLLETPLLHLSDIPGVHTTTTLVPGNKMGTSALNVNVTKGPRINGTVELDNFGNDYTGEYRLGASLRVNNPLGLGDTLKFRALGSDESQLFYRAEYIAPVGPWATKLGIAYSDMEYTLGDEFEDLNATGNAKIATAFVQQNLLRTRKVNINIQLQYDSKKLEDNIGAFGSHSDKDSTLTTLTLSGNVRDTFGGWGITQFSLAFTAGSLDINSYLDQVIDSVTAQSAGSFQRWTPSVMRLQNLGGAWSLHAQIHGQMANKNLDSSEKLSLGGTYGVRAYAQGAATGDQGWLANIEVRYALSDAWQVFGLLDHGEVDVNKTPWLENVNNQRSLTGAGIGARLTTSSWQVSATVAEPINKDDAITQDQDTQFWLQAIWSF